MIEKLGNVTPDRDGQKKNHAEMDKPLTHVDGRALIPLHCTMCEECGDSALGSLSLSSSHRKQVSG
jgi:hypothetical protein